MAGPSIMGLGDTCGPRCASWLYLIPILDQHAGTHQLSLSLGFQRDETQWQGLGESSDVRESWLLGVPQCTFNTHLTKAAPSLCKPLSLSVSLCHNSCSVMIRSPLYKASTQEGLCCIWLHARAAAARSCPAPLHSSA